LLDNKCESQATFGYLSHVAAERNAPQDSTYTFKSNVDVVLVPMVVRDKGGRAVHNLG